MNNRDFNGFGEKIRRAVEYGVDFLNRSIMKRNGSGRYSDPDIVDMPQPPTVYEQKPWVKAVGVLMAVAGLGLGGINLLFTCFVLLGAAIADELLLGLGISTFSLLIAGGFGFLGYKGISMVTSTDRFKTYIRTIGQEELCNIRQLAERVGKTEKFVVKDVEKMIRKGWFCQGHLDNGKTCLMVTDRMYREYRNIEALREKHRIEEEERQKRLREEEEKRKAEEARMKSEQERAERRERARKKGPLWNTSKLDGMQVDDGADQSAEESRGMIRGKHAGRAKLSPEVKKIVEQGDAYVKKIRECNDVIPGEVISTKIDRMEILVDKIFARVEQNPESAGDIRKLMEYYLPTTVKLLETYAEMDAQPVGGANIQAAKKEIEDSLDTINAAFEKLLDSLFQDMAWDVSTDISVLKTMLAQEGLNEDGLKK